MPQWGYSAFDPGAGFAELAQRVRPGVVQLRGAGRGGGTGVVWSAGGTVLTNDHVVAGTRGALRVQTIDGRDLPVTVTARNQELDLALLRVPADDLPPMPVGDSSQLRVGELVFAVGHPWGQPWVVTGGIVSGLGEAETRSGERVPFIHSDVRLAPGNSGGPLLNARGEVVGINAMIFGGDLAVAIPSQTVNAWVGEESGRRAYLGVSVQPVRLLQGAPDGRTAGLLVAGIAPGGPAERAGILIGDLLVSADGVALDQPADLRAAMLRRPAGAALRLWLSRAGVMTVVDVTPGKE